MQAQSNNRDTAKALQGIKVLDLSRILAGPSSTQILADLGAEVIKVEKPKVGDDTRHWTPPSFDDANLGENQQSDNTPTAAYYATVNRNKKSITIDLSKPKGQQLIKQLIKDSDVLVENFKVGGLKKYGLDYASVKTINPKLIYASLTGFGQTGPDAHKPGYDFISQGLSGIMSLTGATDGPPQKIGVPVVDLFAGLELTIGIQAALLARQHTGRGQQVDIALLDSAISMLANYGMNYLASGVIPLRVGNTHPNVSPYQVFATKDDNHFILACGNDLQFARTCKVLGLELHQDERFTTNHGRVVNHDALTEILDSRFLQKTRDDWLALLHEAGVPCAPINDVAEALAMPQVIHRDMIVGFENSPVQVLGSPLKLSDTPVSYHTPPPKLGADTLTVLADLGLNSDELEQLKIEGVV